MLALALEDAGDLAGAMEVVEVILPALDAVGRPGRRPARPGPGRRPPGAGATPATRGPTTSPAGRRPTCAEQAGQIRDDDLRAWFLAAPVNVRLAEVAAAVDG